MPGLADIEALLNAVEMLEYNLENYLYVRQIVTRHQDEIAQMNVSQLYDEGITSTGLSLASFAPYSPYTITLKSMRGQPTDRVTLRDTGAFHEGFKLDIQPEEFYIYSTDEKYDMLGEDYGYDIYGLTKENLAKLRAGIVKPELQKIINIVLTGDANTEFTGLD